MTIDEVMGPWKHFPQDDDPEDETNWGMSMEEFIAAGDKMHESVELFATTASLTEMMELGRRFGSDPESTYDMHFTYRSAFENMPNYPPVELFTEKSGNLMFAHLRDRCYGGKLLRYDDSIAIFHKITTELLQSEEQSQEKLEDILTEDMINKMSGHEIRLLLEVIIRFEIPLDSCWLSLLVARIDIKR
jgi:hypothetical protein